MSKPKLWLAISLAPGMCTWPRNWLPVCVVCDVWRGLWCVCGMWYVCDMWCVRDCDVCVACDMCVWCGVCVCKVCVCVRYVCVICGVYNNGTGYKHKEMIVHVYTHWPSFRWAGPTLSCWAPALHSYDRASIGTSASPAQGTWHENSGIRVQWKTQDKDSSQ